LKLLAAQIETSPGEPGVVLDDGLLIGCGTTGSIRPTLVQRAGKGAMATADLLRGFPVPAGSRLS
jgi:methionyl-tRNA formyltransferase